MVGMYDVVSALDELRTHSTDWLVAEREQLVREQRRLHIKELAVITVLDERGRVDVIGEQDGVSDRTARQTIETARALESCPALAAAAYAGELSAEQLVPAVQLADEFDDAEWAQRAPRIAPGDLARLARTKRAPTVEESRARHEARSLRMWWEKDRGMLQLRGELPDVLGATFEAVIDRITDRMKPAKGHRWDTRDHRRADALVELCSGWECADPTATAAKPLLVTEVPLSGPAEVAGIPLPPAMVEQLQASASVEPVLVGGDGAALGIGKRTTSLSPKTVRAVILRDGHCRCRPGCELRYGLQVHHLRPKSWGGTDELSNLAAVAPSHHPLLIPHGPYALVGNPNQPDGLRAIHLDDLTPEQAAQLGLPSSRAGPSAA
jgi:hypothetical protein